MTGTDSILHTILAEKRKEVDALKSRSRTNDLRRQALEAPAGRDFYAALKDCLRVPIIAEIKKVSPSAGQLGNGVQVGPLARTYQAGGAAALSVLTDRPFFGGSLDDLKEARQAVSLPILRKDFIIDPAQLYESKLAQADAVLLIAAALTPLQLGELFMEAVELGLTPIVEVHNREELNPVLALDPPIVGVNNRDLTTLQVSLKTCLALRPLIPEHILVLGESGIESAEDVKRLRRAGMDAFLVGTSLMRAPDPAAALKLLCQAEG